MSRQPLIGLAPQEVYVVVRTPKEWEQYPLPPALVNTSQILAIFHPENESEYVLVYYSFLHNPGLVRKSDIFIFDWDKRNLQCNGLTPAYPIL